MPSHIQNLFILVTRGDDREAEEVFKRMLAVVEAAEFLRRDDPVRYDEATRLAITAERERALDAALAKLDGVKPVAGCRYKQPPGKPCVELCAVCADLLANGTQKQTPGACAPRRRPVVD